MANAMLDQLFDASKRLISRDEAKRLGLTRYFTGKQCCRGHIDERNTKAGACYSCLRENTKRRWALGLIKEDPEKRHQRYKRRMEARRDEILAQARVNKRNRAARLRSAGIKIEQYPEKKREWHLRQMAERGDELRAKARERARERRAKDPEAARKLSRLHNARRRARDKDRINALKRRIKNENNRIKRFKALSHEDMSVVLAFATLAHFNGEWFASYLKKARELYIYFLDHVKAARTSRAHKRRSNAHDPGHHTEADLKSIRKLQKDKCAMCKCKLRGRGELDHIYPLSKGGSNFARNLQFLCITCNRSKGAKDPVLFAQSKGLLL